MCKKNGVDCSFIELVTLALHALDIMHSIKCKSHRAPRNSSDTHQYSNLSNNKLSYYLVGTLIAH